MQNILIQILLVFLIIACGLLIANLVRLYQVLTNLQEASTAVKKTVLSLTRIATTWRDSAKTVSDVVGEISSYFKIFKKNNNENKKEEGE